MTVSTKIKFKEASIASFDKFQPKLAKITETGPKQSSLVGTG